VELVDCGQIIGSSKLGKIDQKKNNPELDFDEINNQESLKTYVVLVGSERKHLIQTR
jgi:hypothetical protein